MLAIAAFLLSRPAVSPSPSPGRLMELHSLKPRPNAKDAWAQTLTRLTKSCLKLSTNPGGLLQLGALIPCLHWGILCCHGASAGDETRRLRRSPPLFNARLCLAGGGMWGTPKMTSASHFTRQSKGMCPHPPERPSVPLLMSPNGPQQQHFID